MRGRLTKSRTAKTGKLMIQIGRVRFSDLEEGETLGEGTFGTVLSGTYQGRDVAIKKARGAIGSASIMEAFRWAGCQTMGVEVELARYLWQAAG